MKINHALAALPAGYLFQEVNHRVQKYLSQNPDAKLLRLGIGDVTLPLPAAVCRAFSEAALEMGTPEGFRGYGPDYGYDFLIDAIRECDYAPRGVHLDQDEVFISDGAKSDVGALQELFSADAVIAVTDPVYPVYVDSNAMAGRLGTYQGERWSKAVYLPCAAEHDFVPEMPETPVDVLYLCSPNNPTGTALTKAQLAPIVEWALAHKVLIVFDAAYKAFIRDKDVPLSIYEIPGAEKCAIECCSFSKTAGFTGVRCAYTVIPKTVQFEGESLNRLWKRRQSTKLNGVSYPVQRAAAAVFSPDGQQQVKANLDYYLGNAGIILSGLRQAGYEAFGGVNSPYVWMRTPEGVKSWDFFDTLLNRAQVVCTPGAGFGPAGEGYLRLTAFNTKENTQEAVQRILKLL